jgi:hypothetical protein
MNWKGEDFRKVNHTNKVDKKNGRGDEKEEPMFWFDEIPSFVDQNE